MAKVASMIIYGLMKEVFLICLVSFQLFEASPTAAHNFVEGPGKLILWTISVTYISVKIYKSLKEDKK